MTEKMFKAEIEQRTALIEKILKKALPENISFQKTIAEAMEYSLLAGGKRLRPMLMMEAYRLYQGENIDEIAPFMAAMEMIHTYSLVHDDLPAMDNDDYRRGRKTTHVVFGEDMGILAGDALLNYAYETAVSGISAMNDREYGLHALEILTGKAGIYGMIGGQVVDVEMTGKPLDDSCLEFIYRLKTGALIEASLMMGAALAGADLEEISRMEQIGRNIGMAFQIQDDILDVSSTMEELGKPIHSDDRNEKTTYVSLHGMEDAVAAVEQYSAAAIDSLEEMPEKNEFLNMLVRELITRKK